ncbi:MAG TPA: class I SAM-dependent methyltransferase [Fimbriimonadaceae bacterium]|nr:class I SAM-dependent methyltransferase [Fimbriimonadaceae bacterium]
MFTQTARFYDALYSFKDYRKECDAILALAGPGGTLLDVACGTGKHLEVLREDFSCEGLDLDAKLLEVARQRLPGMPLHVGDMTGFDLGKKFNVVTCLFSAIGYATTPESLHAAAKCLAKHIKPGGLAIVEPWLGPDVWKPGRPHLLTVDEPDLKIARMSMPGVEGRVSTIQFEYLVCTAEGFERASEEHRLGLYSQDEYLEAFAAAGLAGGFVESEAFGRGLYVGRLRSSVY